MKKFIITSTLLMSTFATIQANPYWEDWAPKEDKQEKKDLGPQVEFLQKIQQIRSSYQDLIGKEMLLTPRRKAEYQEKAVQYGQEGMRELDEAEAISLLIPDINAQTVLDSTIKAGIAAIIAGSPWKSTMAFVASIAMDLEPYYRENYERLKTHLNKAEYCFEMSDFYLNIARKG